MPVNAVAAGGKELAESASNDESKNRFGQRRARNQEQADSGGCVSWKGVNGWSGDNHRAREFRSRIAKVVVGGLYCSWVPFAQVLEDALSRSQWLGLRLTPGEPLGGVKCISARKADGVAALPAHVKKR